MTVTKMIMILSFPVTAMIEVWIGFGTETTRLELGTNHSLGLKQLRLGIVHHHG